MTATYVAWIAFLGAIVFAVGCAIAIGESTALVMVLGQCIIVGSLVIAIHMQQWQIAELRKQQKEGQLE